MIMPLNKSRRLKDTYCKKHNQQQKQKSDFCCHDDDSSSSKKKKKKIVISEIEVIAQIYYLQSVTDKCT